MNQNKSETLGKEKIFILIIKQSLPAIIAMIVMALYNAVDTIFIGRTVGKLGIAALSIVLPVQLLVGAIGQSIGIGASSIISRLLGSKNKKKAEEVLGISLFFMFSIISVLLIFGFSFAEKILLLFGATKSILPLALSYYYINIFGILFFSGKQLFASLIRSEGNSKYAMFVVGIGAILNIIFDYIFIIILDFGIKGAAYATILGQFTGFILGILFYLGKKNELKLKIKKIKWNFNIIKEISKIGSSTFVRMITGSFMLIILNNSLKFYGGEIAIASFGIIHKIMIFSFLPIVGLSQGLLPIIGYNYGAKQNIRTKKTIKQGILIATVFSVFSFVFLLFFGKFFISLFTNEISLINTSQMFLNIVFIGFPIVGFQIISASVYQALGKSFKAFILTILREIVVLIPLILILPIHFGLNGIFYSYPISDFVSAFVTFFFIRHEIKLLS